MTEIHLSSGATFLPPEPAVTSAITAEELPATIARKNPASPLAWAHLAEAAWRDGNEIEAYAFARVGYHRGLDALRRAGWRGSGSVPVSHAGNRGFLHALYLLGKAAAAIDETDEVTRIDAFLDDCDPAARQYFSRPSTS